MKLLMFFSSAHAGVSHGKKLVLMVKCGRGPMILCVTGSCPWVPPQTSPPCRQPYPLSTKAIWSWMKTPLFSSPQASGGSAGTRWICSYLVFSKGTRRGEQGGYWGCLLSPAPLPPSPLSPHTGWAWWGGGGRDLGCRHRDQPLQSHPGLTQSLA